MYMTIEEACDDGRLQQVSLRRAGVLAPSAMLIQDKDRIMLCII